MTFPDKFHKYFIVCAYYVPGNILGCLSVLFNSHSNPLFNRDYYYSYMMVNFMST